MAQFDLNNYVDTQTRINKFWEHCEHTEQQGFITTELLTDGDNDSFVMIRASVGYIDKGASQVISTGIASEVRTYATERGAPGHNRVNETSWVENCETSAIGRAFANLGYATTGADRPSREEMEKVNNYEAATQNTGQAAPAPSGQTYRPDRGAGGGGYRQAQGGGTPTIQNPGAAPTEKQIKMIVDMAKGKHEDISYAMFEKPFANLNRQEASDIIGELMNARPAKPMQQEVIIMDDVPKAEEPEHTY
jgi:hypothetical protein